MKRIISFVLLTALMLAVTSCGEGQLQESKETKAVEPFDFNLTLNERVGLDEGFDMKYLPDVGFTEYTREFARDLFETLFYSEDGYYIYNHIDYPRDANTKDELEASLKDGSIDIAYIEMTKNEQTFDEGLDYTLIGLYPIMFITAAENPVSSIPGDKLEDLFINREIDNWSKLGGNYGKIHFIRSTKGHNSYDTVKRVLFPEQDMHITLEDGYDLYPDCPQEAVSIGMTYDYNERSNYTLVAVNPSSVFGSMTITFDFDGWSYKPVYIDGIKPTYDSVKNGEYPYTLYTYAVTRKGENDDNIKYLLDWLAEEGISDDGTVGDIYSTSVKSSIGFNHVTMDLLGATREGMAKILTNYRPGADLGTHILPYDETKDSIYHEWLSLVE